MRYDYDHRGYNAVIIGGRSGEVLKTGFFDIFAAPEENGRLKDFLDSAFGFGEDGVPPIVVVAVKTDGSQNLDIDLLRDSFRAVGGKGVFPGLFESYLLIGIPGAQPGSVIEKVGPAFLHAEVGDPADISRSLLEIDIPEGQGLLP